MAHDINRLLRAFSSRAWFIDPRKAEEIVALLDYRAHNGLRAEKFRADGPAAAPPVMTRQGNVAILKLMGPILPRAEAVTDISSPAALMTDFQQAFKLAAADPSVSAIVLDIDSPGGQVDLVPETADMIFAARRAGRPIVSIADTVCCSAAYYIASQADELVVTPSGEVGSIGVYTVHQDISAALESAGVRITIISAGPRKTELNPFEPLTPEAIAHVQASVSAAYDMFAEAVARGMSRKGRKITPAMVKADPEAGKPSFGGGRYYPAAQAVALGMADRVATLDQVIAGLGPDGRKPSGRANSYRVA